jgi:hypothetical protein
MIFTDGTVIFFLILQTRVCIPWAQISVLELGTCETVSCTYLIITLAKFLSVDQCRYHQLSFEIASMLSLTIKAMNEVFSAQIEECLILR